MAFVPEEEMDHISNLPNAIIRHIFSFLPFKEVVKTSVLYKQWRFAWTSSACIDLSIQSTDVVPFISRSQSQRTATKLEKLHMDVPMTDVWIPIDFEGWCCFAAARKVEHVSLVPGHQHHLVPRSLYDCASMVSLRLSNCAFAGAVTVHWPSLKTLCLDKIPLGKDRIMKILSRCPLLELLRLSSLGTRREVSDDSLQIHSGSLRELVMENVNISSLDISAPNLLSLCFSGDFFLLKVVKINEASSLAEAELNFDRPASYVGYNLAWLKFLLKQLQHVPKITFGSRCLEILSTAKPNGESYISSRWCTIKVYITLCKIDLQGMAYLLQSSPFLESLVICNHDDDNKKRKNMNPPELNGFDEQQFWRSQKFYCVANHLKRVEIVGFQYHYKKSKPWLALTRFLLEETVGLEKMTIDANISLPNRRVRHFYDNRCVRDMIYLQEDCQKGSQNAQVIVIYRLNGHLCELCKDKDRGYILKWL